MVVRLTQWNLPGTGGCVTYHGFSETFSLFHKTFISVQSMAMIMFTVHVLFILNCHGHSIWFHFIHHLEENFMLRLLLQPMNSMWTHCVSQRLYEIRIFITYLTNFICFSFFTFYYKWFRAWTSCIIHEHTKHKMKQKKSTRDAYEHDPQTMDRLFIQ